LSRGVIAEKSPELHDHLMNGIALNRFDTIVIGGGQSGLAAGYYLSGARRSFLILDANQRTGDAWRQRWDSLRLFSPAQYDSLPGLPFPGRSGTFPTKDELADYLEGYARHLDLPILRGVRVTRVARHADELSVECGGRIFYCSNVIVAVGAYSLPRLPEFAGLLNPSTVQVHSSQYRKPADVAGDRVLVVGFGTSGIEIAMELARDGRRVMISGRPTSQVLSKLVPAIFAGKNPILKLLGKAYWNFMHRVVTIDTPIGRKAKSQIELRGQPLIRLNRADALAAGVTHVVRTVGVTEGKPHLEDERVVDVSSVVWCTGFRPNYEFLDLPSLPWDAKGLPVAPHGIVEQIPGLYFIGLPFQVGLTSTLVGGSGRDATLVLRHIEQRRRPADLGHRLHVQTRKSEGTDRVVSDLNGPQATTGALRTR
jgi:putative flavoprotein involved in K+ transport